MKKYIRSGILALSLSVLSLGAPAFAQAGGYQGQQGYQDRTSGTTTTRTETGSRGWGWLGLLGLFGLSGLLRRREETTRHRGSDYRAGEPLGSR